MDDIEISNFLKETSYDGLPSQRHKDAYRNLEGLIELNELVKESRDSVDSARKSFDSTEEILVKAMANLRLGSDISWNLVQMTWTIESLIELHYPLDQREHVSRIKGEIEDLSSLEQYELLGILISIVHPLGLPIDTLEPKKNGRKTAQTRMTPTEKATIEVFCQRLNWTITEFAERALSSKGAWSQPVRYGLKSQAWDKLSAKITVRLNEDDFGILKRSARIFKVSNGDAFRLALRNYLAHIDDYFMELDNSGQ